MRRRASALGRKRPAPSQRPSGVGSESVPRLAPAAPLDGELRLGRGRFDALSARVRRAPPDPGEWREVRYMVFDTPVSGIPFAMRLDRLAALAPHLPAQVEVAPQWRVAGAVELERDLARTVAARGEGLTLHVADALHSPGRSEGLLTLKPNLDAEAVVVGHRTGTGKYRGRVGALEVESSRDVASSSAAA